MDAQPFGRLRAGSITFTGNSDQAYIGQKYNGNDNTDFVIQWSDNPETQEWGTDRMKFIFSSAFTGDHTGMGSEYGLEAMRFWPKNAKEVNVGVGDFFAYGGDPTERLHVRDGRVRIQQLPDDQEAPELTKFLVVDDSPGNERGVVKWRNLPVVPPASSCDWTLLGTPGSNSNIATAYNGNPGCPQGDKRVGIGTNAPQAKLSVESREVSQGGPGIGVDVKLHSDASDWATGIRVNVLPESGPVGFQYGINSIVENATSNNFAIMGRGMVDAGNTVENNGVRARAIVLGSGQVAKNVGGHFRADQNADGHITKNYGVWSEAYGGDKVTGVYALADHFGSTGTTESIGLDAMARNGTVKNIGVSGVSNTTHLGVGINYGVYGNAMNGSVNWAGYFAGNVNATGIGYYVNGVYVASDAQFKANVGPLEDPLGTIMQLQSHQYDFLTDEYPQMNFPAGMQAGLVAQELESVIPALVSNTRVEAVTDTTGTEIFPAVEYKAVNYSGLVPYLVGAVQQQQATIAQMQDQIAQCCAANQGMAPQDGPAQREVQPMGDLQEQRLLIIPNPVADLTTLEYYVPKAGRISLSVSNSDGKPMGTLREEQAEPGAYSYQWNTTKLAAGTYFCTYLLDGNVVVKRAVKVK